MARRRRRDVKRTSEWRRSWLVVLAACSGFAVASLQPSVVVTDEVDTELIYSYGFDVEMLEADGDEATASWRFSDIIERALAEMNRTGPTPTTTRAITTTEQPVTTTTERPTTTTTERPTTTTTEQPTTTTTEQPTTTIATAAPQSATAQAEQRFVELINRDRSAAGLPALSVNSEIRTVARKWTATMISQADSCNPGDLRHNPNHSEQIPRGWTRVAENVGCGQSVDSLHRAFMASPGHEANIMDPDFTDVGIGVGFDAAGDMWVTQNFAQYSAG